VSSAVADVTGKVKRYLDNKEPTTENVPLKSVREAEYVESCLNLSELPELKSLGATVLAYRTSNCPCLKVTAAKDNIKDAVRVVQQQSSSILMESHKYSKAGEAKFLEKNEANMKTKAKEMQCSLYLSQEHVVKSSPPKSFTHKIGNFMTLSIAEGDLHHFTADALTCPMNANLAFGNPVAQCFLQFGGDEISEVCKTQQKQQQSLLPGDVVLSDAGKLNAGTLIYAVLPQKGQRLDSHYLQSAVYNSLLKAEGKGCASMALPAVGCESFGFSVKDSCVALRAAVLQFCSDRQNSPKNIRCISIVDSDEEIVEEYNTLIQELGFPDTSTTVPLQSLKLKHGSDTRVLINGVPICLKNGDITKETVDVIVNSTNKSLDLNTGVSGAILKAAGQSVVDECKKQAPQKTGAAVLTGAGALQCKFIAQMVGPDSTADITSSLEMVLNLCEAKTATTLAIPAIGTGRGGFAPKESIKAIFTALEKHLKEPNSSCFRSITVVAFEQKTFDDFRDHFKVWNKPASGKMPENQVKIVSVRIEVKKGDITNETVRGIVNTTNRDMSLRGGVSGAIFKAAGASVEQECQKHGALQNDVAAVTSGGNLHCDFIIHMVGPHSAAEVRSRVKNVLECCEEKQITTVSFPAVGTGGGGVQDEDAIGAMLQGFEDHLSQNVSTVIKLIYIVIDRDNVLQEFQKGLKTWIAKSQESEDDEYDEYDDDDVRSITVVAFEQKTFDDFRDHFKVWNKPASGKMPENQVKIVSVRIEVKKGDITNETVRGIVNTTNRDMSLRGGVSGAIFKAAGASVEQECQKHGALQNDVAAVTSGGNLHCDFIIHMVGPHSAAEVRSRVKNVLECCEEKQITTVSFPAVGTGGGGVQDEDAIGAMLQGFEDHLSQNVSTVIKLIYIVIDRDNVLQEFQKGLKTWIAKSQESEDDEYDEYDDDDGDDELEDYSSTDESSSSDQGADASANPVEVMMGLIKVKVLCGDITKETVEAIVNSTTTSLDLNTGVSGAILKASGQMVVNECKSKAPQPADGVILTTAGNLSNIKHIIHMVGQTNEKGISSSMYKVLGMCEENKIQSVSFPALGTGAGNLAAAGVANAMTEALTNFMKDSPKHLKRVHLVIFQAKLLPDFQEAVKKCKKISRNASAHQVKPLQQPVIPVLTQRPAICLAKETAAVSFPVMAVDVYGTSPTNLAKVKKLLDELVKQECFSIDVQLSHNTDLPETDKKAIVALSRANQVSVLVASSDKLTVSGKRDDVLDAVLKINGFIQAARDREKREGEVKRLRETLCWEVARGERWESLEPNISYDIELTFHRKEKSFQYQENGDTYTVDFKQMEVTNSKRESCRIKRTLLGDSDTAIIHPPPTWTKMDGRDLEIITLQSNSVEYKNIETAFLKSSIHRDVKPVQVQQIDRIQSQSQWQRYCVLKQAVDKKYPKQTNERQLYHGTTKEICQKINKNGFNRSFCGRNAVYHGEGTYFGKEAWYSCQDKYSNPDDKGLKYIYRARVVTGSLCKSREGMKEPDPINPADPRAGLHDCAVDSLQNPFIFVVFCDAGAYPEYLITFKSI
ncbi:poly [ADP-ribose] polymerase 14-like, partial [Sinocyclocheilus grahami]